METIEQRGFILQITEYGKVVRQYHDNDYERFSKVTKEIINEHLDRYSKQSGINSVSEYKNIQINIYTN